MYFGSSGSLHFSPIGTKLRNISTQSGGLTCSVNENRESASGGPANVSNDTLVVYPPAPDGVLSCLEPSSSAILFEWLGGRADVP